MEIARAWAPIGLGLTIADKACQGKNFLSRLLTREPNLDRVTPTEVFDAARPDVPAAISTQEHYRRERAAAVTLRARADEGRRSYLRSNPADEAVRESNERDRLAREAGTAEPGNSATPSATLAAVPVVIAPYTTLPPLNSNGFIRVFESTSGQAGGPAKPITSSADIDGEGTLLTSDGLQTGHFENGELEGEGQEITSGGVWRGGTYDNGDLEGPGFEVFERNGEVVAIEADFVDDKPDGMARVILADGSSRMDLWRGGQLVAMGTVAPRGRQPAPAVYRSAQDLAATDESQLDAAINAAPSAAALYALADERAEKGDTAGALRAFRRILTRFPTSPFALRASDRLAALAGQPNRASAPPVRTASSQPATSEPQPTASGLLAYVESVCRAERSAAPGGHTGGNWGDRDVVMEYQTTRALNSGGSSLGVWEHSLQTSDPNFYPGQEQEARAKLAYWSCGVSAIKSKLGGR